MFWLVYPLTTPVVSPLNLDYVFFLCFPFLNPLYKFYMFFISKIFMYMYNLSTYMYVSIYIIKIIFAAVKNTADSSAS